MQVLAAWSWALDGWIIVAGVLCAGAAALVGNFLVLRRMSMLGDAISHAVLPGLAAAFFLSGTRNSFPMFAGAAIVGVFTALFTEWIRGIGKVDEGASMGVVFTSLFALGLVMIVQAADRVDLDPGCVLYGAIELTPLDTLPLAGCEVPRAVLNLAVVLVVNSIFVVVFFKELKITAFDPTLATAAGLRANLMHYLLMILVAVTAVASFETVGNILVVAMMVVPPAAAYMLTDRLARMIVLSMVLAAMAAVLGYVGAVTLPTWFGYRSTTTSGMMAVAAGCILVFAVLFGPKHGVVVKFVRQRIVACGILAEDVMGLLYRITERGGTTKPTVGNLRSILSADRLSLRCVLQWLVVRREVCRTGSLHCLTETGNTRTKELVRSHRLWEQYLVSQAGVEEKRTHRQAEHFEHFTNRQLRDRLDAETNTPHIDPHGKPIPTEHGTDA